MLFIVFFSCSSEQEKVQTFYEEKQEKIWELVNFINSLEKIKSLDKGDNIYMLLVCYDINKGSKIEYVKPNVFDKYILSSEEKSKLPSELNNISSFNACDSSYLYINFIDDSSYTYCFTRKKNAKLLVKMFREKDAKAFMLSDSTFLFPKNLRH